jgi:alcohol dehydrogenase class IV
MWPLKVAWYRTFQAVFNIGARFLPWRKAITAEGAGSIGKIPGLLTALHVSHPIIVTDPGLMAAGVAPRILQVLDKASIPYTLYNAVEANPSVNTVNAIFQRNTGDHCDGIIAIGGGSAMDAAKAAAARAVNPGKSVTQLGGLLKVHKKLPPFIAIPTTAGTGSETTIAALITDTDTHHKFAIMDLHLIPLYAVLDADLTVGLPPLITATTGMDALTHAVEAYLCWTYNTKESIRFAEDAVALIFKYLERAYKDGLDIEAREAMQTASFKAGFAFTRAGVGNVHAVAHTLGGLYNTPHGLANAVLLPVVLEDYGKKVYPKLARLAELAGIAGPGDEAGRAKAFIQSIREMNARMGIPAGFDFIRAEDIGRIVKWAGAEANPLYPVPVLYSPERFRSVIQKLRAVDTVKKG